MPKEQKSIRLTLYGIGVQEEGESDAEYIERMTEFVRTNGQIERAETN